MAGELEAAFDMCVIITLRELPDGYNQTQFVVRGSANQDGAIALMGNLIEIHQALAKKAQTYQRDLPVEEQRSLEVAAQPKGGGN